MDTKETTAHVDDVEAAILESLRNAQDIDPDKHDPSYELARTAARLYALDFPTHVGVPDLDMFLALVTFGSNEFRKKRIDESSLGADSKAQLTSLLDALQLKWESREYERNEFAKGFGMFGAGFRTFNAHKMSNDDARRLVRLFADISANDLNEEAKYELVRDCFSQSIRGMRNASASEILHCIDPLVFPIINGHQGRDNLYPLLIEKIPNSGNKRNDLTRYAEYCEIIRNYRNDQGFDFKNYRVFDLEEQKLPQRRRNAKRFPAQTATRRERSAAVLRAIEDESSLDEISSRASAPNIFKILKIEDYEIRHSNMLAWLLDPSQNHDLGEEFLKRFLMRLGDAVSETERACLEKAANADLSDTVIAREYKRIDLLIRSENADLAILIENKTKSGETGDQLNTYREYAEDHLTESNVFYAYLTPTGKASSDTEHWKSMSYRQLVDDLDDILSSKEDLDNDILVILKHYSDIVKSELLEEGICENAAENSI